MSFNFSISLLIFYFSDKSMSENSVLRSFTVTVFG